MAILSACTVRPVVKSATTRSTQAHAVRCRSSSFLGRQPKTVSRNRVHLKRSAQLVRPKAAETDDKGVKFSSPDNFNGGKNDQQAAKENLAAQLFGSNLQVVVWITTLSYASWRGYSTYQNNPAEFAEVGMLLAPPLGAAALILSFSLYFSIKRAIKGKKSE
ncbi:hypothetical protein CYMTET_17133 [Cymbomonas tetramitiformis]|uniref:Uncharacterized protein n=1 Tax=Cymbomonas tetramitiformis TaxID=36881 RepID=A0AAE0GAI0_9CHLO|nr:hypothetical protein CYMTET_17133 [Cymbomonas tetramitiformis]